MNYDSNSLEHGSGRGEGLLHSPSGTEWGEKLPLPETKLCPGRGDPRGSTQSRALLPVPLTPPPPPLPAAVKFFRYFTRISNSVILLKFIQRIYAYEIII